MEFILSILVPLVVTAAMLLAAMLLAIAVGNVSGRLIRKILGVGGN